MYYINIIYDILSLLRPKFTQKFNIPIGMLYPYFPLSEKLLLFTGSLLLSVALSTTAELVRNADSQVPPGPTESEPAS